MRKGVAGLLEETIENYPKRVRNFIECYGTMLSAIIAALRAIEDKGGSVSNVLDIGCGIGELSLEILTYCLTVQRLTCVDRNNATIELLKQRKIGYGFKDKILAQQEDIFRYEPDVRFNAIVSNLVFCSYTREQKLKAIHKIYDWLAGGGIEKGFFIWGDRIRFNNDFMNEYVMNWRKIFAKRNGETDQLIEMAFEEEMKGCPLTISETYDLFAETNFCCVESVWQYNNFAVFLAAK